MRYENRNLKRSLIIATVGLYISGFAAVFNFIGFKNIIALSKTIAEWICTVSKLSA